MRESVGGRECSSLKPLPTYMIVYIGQIIYTCGHPSVISDMLCDNMLVALK